MLKLGLTAEELIAVTTFFLDSVLSQFMLPGQVENWVVVLDSLDLGVTDMPYSVTRLDSSSSNKSSPSCRTTSGEGCTGLTSSTRLGPSAPAGLP